MEIISKKEFARLREIEKQQSAQLEAERKKAEAAQKELIRVQQEQIAKQREEIKKAEALKAEQAKKEALEAEQKRLAQEALAKKIKNEKLLAFIVKKFDTIEKCHAEIARLYTKYSADLTEKDGE